MKKTIWTIVVIIIILGISLVQKNKNGGTSDFIKIAALLSLSGDAAAWGENAQKGIKLAEKHINDAGGINGKKVEVIYEDTAGDPKKAVSAFQYVLTRGDISMVIGPLNQTEDIAVAPIIAKTNMPTIVPGYIPLQNRTDLNNPLVIWMNPEIETNRLAQHVYDQGIRKVGIIGTLDSWETLISDTFEKKFKEFGGTITAKEIVQPQDSEMKLPVTKVVNSKPEAIFLGTYYQFVNSLKVLNDLGYKGKVYSIEVDNYLAGEAAAWSNGLQFIAPDYYTEDFVKAYKDLNAAEPGIPAGQAYDAANIAFNFLKQSEKRSDIIEAMKSFKSYEGVSGKLEIHPDHTATLPTAIFEIKNGKIERINKI